jgi:asparagine synthase (glutamine-hydrolysing)
LSGFAVIYERSNTPVDPGVLERVMGRLNHRGPDGRDLWQSGSVGMGHWHFWTVPEEVGERQPLRITGLSLTIVMDGRLDNRFELIHRLAIPMEEEIKLSDATLALQAYSKWGEDYVKFLIGDFAIVIYDERYHKLICSRDPLGERTLFYTNHRNLVVIASEPRAILDGVKLSVELDERALAHFFAFRFPADGQTLFKNVKELLPAHQLVIQGDNFKDRVYWQVAPKMRNRRRTDKFYADEFRSLLEESVRCRLRTTGQPGVLMSGGLDSTSVACLAAKLLAPVAVTTISYIFDEFPECDERPYINAVQEMYRTISIQICSDDLWPYKNWESWSQPPNFPEGNVYRQIKNRAYQRAHQEGINVLLTGGFGDHLYTGDDDCLTDLLVDGRLQQALREGMYLVKRYGLRNIFQSRNIRRLGHRSLELILGFYRNRHQQNISPWLTSYAGELLDNGDYSYNKRQDKILGLITARSSTMEIYQANRHGIELRHPYRDRRLVEFMISLPGYQLYSQGLYKIILRNAMKSILPESIRTRKTPTSLVSLYSAGLERERVALQAYVDNLDAFWKKFVKEDWMETYAWKKIIPETDGPKAVIPWLCFSSELWRDSLFQL